MTLEPGVRLGPYEILSPLGAGGMGEVYKALDTRLDRTVAIKVLPAHIANREDLRQRFEREARAVASLNHPHICVLHDIGTHDATSYMVLEYLEGETLAARIAKGPLPLDQALKFGTQIADALDRAHRAGVTHRDIKPANIVLTRDGVKLLDFGLAKSVSKTGPSDATLTQALTAEGSILGTPQYMAPEQFEGREADARSDIWAFGAVLYEIVTGQKPFQGNSYSSMVGAILSAEPPPMSLKPFTPTGLERLVRRCLAKDPEDRYQSMRDVVLDLRTPPEESAAKSPGGTSRLPWAVATLCLIAALIGWGSLMRKSAEPSPPVALNVNPAEGLTFSSIANAGGSAISPHGRTLAFVATNERGETSLYVRPLESLAARALPGTEDAGRPFWSPDSKSLAFVAGGRLKRIDPSAGTPVTLCEAGRARGGAWNEDGVILFGDQGKGLQRIAASGGVPSFVTQIDAEAGEIAHYYPQFLPGGKQFLYLVRHRDQERMGIAIGSLDEKPLARSKVIVKTESKAHYDAASGRLLLVHGAGTLIATKMRLNPPILDGDPVTVAEDLRVASVNGYAEFSLSANGSLFYGQGDWSGNVRFTWRDRTGKLLNKIGEPRDMSASFCLSPDGEKVAFSSVSANGFQQDLWVLDLSRGLSTRFTFNNASYCKWSPDGKYIYYSSRGGIYRKPADGSGDEESVLTLRSNNMVNSLSPNGKLLLFGLDDIMALSLSGERKVEPYLDAKYSERNSSFSPDGRWVAYQSNESGRMQVYVQGFPDKRGKWLVSEDEGGLPSWRQDGRELYWVRPDGTVMAASMELQPAGVRSGNPEPLFKLLSLPGSTVNFQPSRDGRRFLVREPESGQGEPLMVVIQNWAARLGK